MNICPFTGKLCYATKSGARLAFANQPHIGVYHCECGAFHGTRVHRRRGSSRKRTGH